MAYNPMIDMLRAQLKALEEAEEKTNQDAPQSNLQKLISEEVQRQLNLVSPAQGKEPRPEPVSSDKFAMMAVINELANTSLKPAELDWLHVHVVSGAPGFQQFLRSEAIKTLVQVAFENYRDFLEGKVK